MVDNTLFGVGRGFSTSTAPSIGTGLTSDFLGQTTGLDRLFTSPKLDTGTNGFGNFGFGNFGFGQNLGVGSNFGGGNGLTSQFGIQGGQGNINGMTQNLPGLGQQQGGFLGGLQNGLQNFSDKFLNKDFLLGGKDKIGALTGGAAIAQSLGGLYNSNREFNLGKKQYNDQLAIFNNNQQNLKEDSIRRAQGILDNSTFAKDFTDEERQAYIDQRAYKPKTI